MMIEDVMANILALVTARLLFESEVNAAVHPGIVNVVADLPAIGVVEDHARRRLGTGPNPRPAQDLQQSHASSRGSLRFVDGGTG